jgi:hypothetical protein
MIDTINVDSSFNQQETTKELACRAWRDGVKT